MHTDTQKWKAGGVAVGVPAAKQVVWQGGQASSRGVTTAVLMIFGTVKLIEKMHVSSMMALDWLIKDSWGRLPLVVGGM